MTYNERMTLKSTVSGRWGFKSGYSLECCAKRLAEYENTGLLPSEVEELKCPDRVSSTPCKIGDKVYYICEEFEEYGGNYVSELTITEISNVRFWVENEDENHFRFTDIGKTVFLTREEAEAAKPIKRAPQSWCCVEEDT